MHCQLFKIKGQVTIGFCVDLWVIKYIPLDNESISIQYRASSTGIEIWMVIPLAVLLLLISNVLFILSLLYFYMKFCIVISTSVKGILNFDWECIEFVDCFDSLGISTILSI